MRKTNVYHIIIMGLSLGLVLSIASGSAQAQAGRSPNEMDMYCTSVATGQPVPADAYIISGENSKNKLTFVQGDYVYVNRGSEQGVKIGDQFEVIRPEHDIVPTKWFKWQTQLAQAMGTMYADIGRVHVVAVQAKTSTAQISLGCDLMQRGDIVQPFTARPAPTYHNAKFDLFAGPSGKKTAMVVQTKHFGLVAGANTTVFVNLGSDQGVKVGDYFRVFRYQGTQTDTLYALRGTAYKVYGFGSAPVAYEWDNLPRQVIGEGIVVRTGPNSSTVVLTLTRQEVFAGDYVEIE